VLHGYTKDTRFPLKREADYINGQWLGAPHVIDVTDPADGSVLGSVPDMGAAEAQTSVEAAHEAFASWRSLTGKARGEMLQQWAELVRDNIEDLALLLTSEQGKPLREARSEVLYAASYLQWFSEEARRIQGDILGPDRTDRRLLVRREPVGVVAAITPWNFPLAMITRKAGPALAVGCTMVLKPSELTPFSALALAGFLLRPEYPQVSSTS